MGDKRITLQVLESAIAKCGLAVLDGTMSIQDYEEATGRSGEELRKQVEENVRKEYERAAEAVRAQTLTATQAAYDKLIAAGMAEDVIAAILGNVTVEDGVVTAPDWSKVTS